MNSIVIFGSARSFGNTRQAVTEITAGKKIALVDLKKLTINSYDYENNNQDDDFIPLIEKALEFDTIVFATPVYWYSMSAVMKNFVDRFSDLLYARKDLGQKLRGKNLFLITTFGGEYPNEIIAVFKSMANYLGMKYLGAAAIFSETYNQELLENNKAEIAKAAEIFK